MLQISNLIFQDDEDFLVDNEEEMDVKVKSKDFGGKLTKLLLNKDVQSEDTISHKVRKVQFQLICEGHNPLVRVIQGTTLN